MAVDPFHWVGRAEGQRAREHLVKANAERIEIAPRIDRAVHPSSLFGRHIGERPSDELGRRGRGPLARKARCYAESRKLDRPGRAVHQNIGRLDVLVDQAPPVDLAQRSSDGDCKMQEVPHLEGRNEQPIKGFAAVVFQHQHGSIAVAH